jgi:hypothetical protein
MANLLLKNWIKTLFWITGLLLLSTVQAYAAVHTGDMPFNSRIDNLKANVFAFVFAASSILLMAMCLMMAFGEWGDGMKKIINIVFWLSLGLTTASGATYIVGSGAVF